MLYHILLTSLYFIKQVPFSPLAYGSVSVDDFFKFVQNWFNCLQFWCKNFHTINLLFPPMKNLTINRQSLSLSKSWKRGINFGPCTSEYFGDSLTQHLIPYQYSFSDTIYYLHLFAPFPEESASQRNNGTRYSGNCKVNLGFIMRKSLLLFPSLFTSTQFKAHQSFICRT